MEMVKTTEIKNTSNYEKITCLSSWLLVASECWKGQHYRSEASEYFVVKNMTGGVVAVFFFIPLASTWGHIYVS